MLGAHFDLGAVCGHSDGRSGFELALPHLTELCLLVPGNAHRFNHLPGGLPALRTLVVSATRDVHCGCLERLTGLEALDVTEPLGLRWQPVDATRKDNCLTQVRQ